MRWPGRTIWDTRVQCVCGVLSARGDDGVQVFLSATFAQATLSPPRLIVNLNRTYAIEPAVGKFGKLAVNVMPASSRERVLRLMRMRRRQPRKAEFAELKVSEDDRGIPFLQDSLRTVFCEVETALETGDRKVYVTRVLESRVNPALAGERPLLFAEVSDRPLRFDGAQRYLRAAMMVSGAGDVIKRAYYRLRPPPPPDIAANTYRLAGATEEEIAVVNQYGVLDQSRRLSPPRVPGIVRRNIGVCVVGTGWGSFHCDLVRRASPAARVFVCGQKADRTARVARAVGAEDYFVGMEKAIADPRVQALILALPHDLHRQAAELAAAAGKHALVEKPIATNLADADAMIEAAKRAGTILMVAEDMHFRPTIREAVRRTILGDIGEPLYLLAHAGGLRRPQGWAAQAERMGGGVLMDIGVHYVRALRLLMGEPDSVLASRGMQINTKMSGEDSVQLLFSSRAGWEAHMLLSWASVRGYLPDIVVAGEKGTFHLWPSAPFLDYYPADPCLIVRLGSYVRPYWLRELWMHPRFGRVRIKVPEREGTGYADEVCEFLSAIAEERQPVTPPEDGRRDLEIVLRCYDALTQCRRADIPSDDARFAQS